MQGGGLVVSRARVQKLMNIEQLFKRKFNEVKSNFFEGNWGVLLILLETLND